MMAIKMKMLAAGKVEWSANPSYGAVRLKSWPQWHNLGTTSGRFALMMMILTMVMIFLMMMVINKVMFLMILVIFIWLMLCLECLKLFLNKAF